MLFLEKKVVLDGSVEIIVDVNWQGCWFPSKFLSKQGCWVDSVANETVDVNEVEVVVSVGLVIVEDGSVDKIVETVDMAIDVGSVRIRVVWRVWIVVIVEEVDIFVDEFVSVCVGVVDGGWVVVIVDVTENSVVLIVVEVDIVSVRIVPCEVLSLDCKLVVVEGVIIEE